MSNRREKAILRSINNFFEEKRDLLISFTLFERTFESFKCKTYDNKNVYLLDSLTEEQKKLFFEYYNYALSGAGEYYSNLYCNDLVYRSHYNFPNSILVLIGK